MNVKLLLQVKAHILEEPRRLAMSTYVEQGLVPGDLISRKFEHGGRPDAASHEQKLTAKTAPPCGTVGCIAGWATLLSNERFYREVQAADLLGINGNQRRKLFYPFNWPKRFYKQFLAAKTAKARAQVTAKVIDDFIKRYS